MDDVHRFGNNDIEAGQSFSGDDRHELLGSQEGPREDLREDKRGGTNSIRKRSPGEGNGGDPGEG